MYVPTSDCRLYAVESQTSISEENVSNASSCAAKM